MHLLDNLMYQISGLFLFPVLLIIVLLFLYSIYALGDFMMQFFQRRENKQQYHQLMDQWKAGENDLTHEIKGFDLLNYALKEKHFSEDMLSVHALKNLEVLRLVTRIAPMLGLVATMIPMGPALKSLANGNIQGISENLVVAFSAVIFGLIVASVTFWIATVKKRWLADEMVDLLIVAEREES